MKYPVFHISGIQEFSDKPQKSLVSDTFPKNINQYVMIDIVEESFNIAFDKPFHGSECLLYVYKSGMTTSFGTEPMWSMFKTALIDCFKYHSDYFLYQLIIKRGYAKRTFFPVFLRYVRPFGRIRLISLIFKTANQLFNSVNAHSVNGFTINSCRHVACLAINILIGYIKHFLVKQHSIQPLKLIVQVTAVFTQTVQHIFWISHVSHIFL